MKKMLKKIKKNPGMGPVPGLKYFYYYFYPKKYFKPRYWACARVFFDFFYIFFMVYNIFFVFEKIFGGQPTWLFKILSNEILI